MNSIALKKLNPQFIRASTDMSIHQVGESFENRNPTLISITKHSWVSARLNQVLMVLIFSLLVILNWSLSFSHPTGWTLLPLKTKKLRSKPLILLMSFGHLMVLQITVETTKILVTSQALQWYVTPLPHFLSRSNMSQMKQWDWVVLKWLLQNAQLFLMPGCKIIIMNTFKNYITSSK